MKKDIWALIVIVLVVIAGGVYYWVSPRGATNVPVSTAETSPAEIQVLLEKLGQHLVLPMGETPEIGQIDDPVQAVKTQPFLAGVQKGDVLIVYVKAQKAIVYSPARDLIINVGPVSLAPESTSNQEMISASSSAPVKN
ncbi:MAG: hypothetical protein WC531_00575 [Candidatus Paceibacterota bacterium]|jgi:hypothetical protein